MFVQNASTGVNTALRNLKYERNDAIIHFDTAYGAVKRTIESLLETSPVLQDFAVDYHLPCSHETIVENFLAVVQQVKSNGLTPKVAVFDTIVSHPGVRFPFEQLTLECRKHGILSVVDGAHGYGHITFDLSKTDPDFFVTTLHKWFFVPRPAAVFFVPKRNQHLIRTTYPTSHGFVPIPRNDSKIPQPLDISRNQTPFTILFQHVSTNDNSPYYTAPSAETFRNDICGGEEKIQSYNKSLAARGGEILAKALGTVVMDETSQSSSSNDSKPVSKLRDCAFSNVLLPFKLVDTEDPKPPTSASASSVQSPAQQSFHPIPLSSAVPLSRHIERVLLSDHKTYVPVFTYKNQLWFRLSGQIYLDEDDFVWFAGVMKDVCGRVTKEFGLEVPRSES